MTREQQIHLDHIKRTIIRRVDAKYKRGAKEHGGNLLNMNGLRILDEAIDEATDLMIYLLTERQRYGR